MDESLLGSRDRRGYWAPAERLSTGPLFEWPLRPRACARWLFGPNGYLFGFNLWYFVVAAACWFLATPSVTTTEDLSVGWIGLLLVRNAVIVVAWFGGAHLWMYRRRSQGTRFKCNERWPSTTGPQFTFNSQTRDNVFWTLASGVPVWTAYEVLTLWMFSAGHLGWLDLRDNPVWFVGLMLLIPFLRDLHFYWVHRLIHWPPLYRLVHALHHRNTNPGPWSGLSMHPLEHLAYFSVVLVHWVLPSHPLHAGYTLLHAVMAPVPGHLGFDRVELNGRLIGTNGFAHYLHHKYFEVNYSDGAIPLDRWFGTFHDGSAEATAALKQSRIDRRHAAIIE